MITIKRTQTFHARVLYNPRSGDAPNLEGIMLKSCVLTSDNQRHELSLNVSLDNLSFTVQSDTSNWSIGNADWDIRFSEDNGLTWFSNTYPMEVFKNITY